jgi:t-SNARE complex subunit (syntaxin)
MDPQRLIDHIKSSGAFDLWKSKLIERLKSEGVIDRVKQNMLQVLETSEKLQKFDEKKTNKQNLARDLLNEITKTKIVKNLQATFDDTFAGSDDLQDQIKESVTQSKIQYLRFL